MKDALVRYGPERSSNRGKLIEASCEPSQRLVRLAYAACIECSIASLGAGNEARLQSTLEPSGLPLRMPFSEKSETAENGRNSTVPLGRFH